MTHLQFYNSAHTDPRSFTLNVVFVIVALHIYTLLRCSGDYKQSSPRKPPDHFESPYIRRPRADFTTTSASRGQ